MAPSSSKPLIVGQAPSSRSDPARPLSGTSGGRLAELLGLPSLSPTFDCVNLVDEYPGARDGKGDRFPAREARAAADAIRAVSPHGKVILLGRSVCAAFRLADLAPLERRYVQGRVWLHVPHPSAVNRWWNDDANWERTRLAIRDLVGLDLRSVA